MGGLENIRFQYADLATLRKADARVEAIDQGHPFAPYVRYGRFVLDMHNRVVPAYLEIALLRAQEVTMTPVWIKDARAKQVDIGRSALKSFDELRVLLRQPDLRETSLSLRSQTLLYLIGARIKEYVATAVDSTDRKAADKGVPPGNVQLVDTELKIWLEHTVRLNSHINVYKALVASESKQFDDAQRALTTRLESQLVPYFAAVKAAEDAQNKPDQIAKQSEQTKIGMALAVVAGEFGLYGCPDGSASSLACSNSRRVSQPAGQIINDFFKIAPLITNSQKNIGEAIIGNRTLPST